MNVAMVATLFRILIAVFNRVEPLLAGWIAGQGNRSKAKKLGDFLSMTNRVNDLVGTLHSEIDASSDPKVQTEWKKVSDRVKKSSTSALNALKGGEA